MKPYLIEGLDCSGKKTVGAIVEGYFGQPGRYPVRCCIGPMVRSPLRAIDNYLTHVQRSLRHGEALDVIRRVVYLAGPAVDGLFSRPSKDYTTIKISSHYRAQARAIIGGDVWMSRWFSRLERINVTFGGCAYLTVPFKLRIERHRIDVARGQTAKVEARRFLNYDEEAFLQWDGCLRELLAQHIPNVQEIAATYNVNQVAQHVIEHIEYCRHIGAIS